MANTTKKQKILSDSDLIQATGNLGERDKTILWRHREVIIKRFLTLDEYIETIRAIMRNCVDENGKIATELVDFSIRANIVASYAYVELPKDTDKLFYVLYANDGIYDAVLSVANQSQIISIEKTIKDYM